MRKVIVLGLVLGVAGCGRAKTTTDLVHQLHEKNLVLRVDAVRELGQRQAEAEEAVAALAAALWDPNSFVRRDAAAALGKFGPEARAAVPALQAARTDRERSVRRAAEAALRQIDPEAAARPVGNSRRRH